MKKLMWVSLLTVAMFIIGCGGAVELDAPEIDSVVMDESSVTVSWIIDTAIEDDPDFSGYNVYVYTDSTELLTENGEDLNKDNATVITGNSYTVSDLIDTLEYYIQVRTVNVDEKVGTYNADVPFVMASPRPEFTATVKFELNTPGVDDSCAIRFSDATIMYDSAMVSGGADMWVDYWTGTQDTTAFDSPSHNTEWGTGARVTAFANMGQMDFDDLSEVTTEPDITTYVGVVSGDLVVAKTEDGNYVKIHVDALDDSVDYTVTITYAYQNIPDYPFFSKGTTRNQD